MRTEPQSRKGRLITDGTSTALGNKMKKGGMPVGCLEGVVLRREQSGI
jgi:hypothetical protein